MLVSSPKCSSSSMQFVLFCDYCRWKLKQNWDFIVEHLLSFVMTKEGSPAESYKQRTKGPMGNLVSVNIEYTEVVSGEIFYFSNARRFHS